MPRRWGVNTRLWAYRYLALRDGEFCARCFKIPTAQNKLDIDHCDGDPQNNAEENLRLLCRGCNVSLENISPKMKAQVAQESSAQNVCVRGNPSTHVLKQAVDFKLGSPEMQVAYLCELDFREWVLSQVLEQGNILKKEAIAGGAERVGCSPMTTARYLDKLTSAEGPLTTQKDMLGDTHLVYKPGLNHQGEK